jgi:hypothetical protein
MIDSIAHSGRSWFIMIGKSVLICMDNASGHLQCTIAKARKQFPLVTSASAVSSVSGYPLGGATASFAALATRNFRALFAGICMVSPVAGLRPARALRFTMTSFPMPGMVNPAPASWYASSAWAASTSSTCFFVSPVLSAMVVTIWALVLGFESLVISNPSASGEAVMSNAPVW